MTPEVPYWFRPRHLSDEDYSEIVHTEPREYRAHITRMSNWNDGYKCAIYGKHERQLALALRKPTAIEAFRAAREQLEGDTVRWRGTDVEVSA